jgi:hypothetical protein
VAGPLLQLRGIYRSALLWHAPKLQDWSSLKRPTQERKRAGECLSCDQHAHPWEELSSGVVLLGKLRDGVGMQVVIWLV